MKKINYIPEDKDKDLTLTWFYDDIPEEFRQVRKNVQGLEEEYLELRQLLQETEERLAQSANRCRDAGPRQVS